MSSSWGEKIKISIFGGSHTAAIGVNIDGLPAGEKIDMDEILLQMGRRAPGQDRTATQRSEEDLPEILCGVSEDNILTGAPLCAVIYNRTQNSKDYENLRFTPRPGHADYTAAIKYSGFNDIRGGGHFSGRLTAPLVFAGAVCRQILQRRGIEIGAHALAIGGVEDRPFDAMNLQKEELIKLNRQYFPVISQESAAAMREAVMAAKEAGDSVGGIVECAVAGLPAGLGSPMFGGAENLISSIVFGIPAVKGIEFGAGFESARLKGSENNDPFVYDGDSIKTISNNAGGILGGITTGMPLVFRAAIKPTPSIAKPQMTVDLSKKQNAGLVINGRHDPCIVPRAVPVVEAAAAVAIINML